MTSMKMKKFDIKRIPYIPVCVICREVPTHTVSYTDPDRPGPEQYAWDGKTIRAPLVRMYVCDLHLPAVIQLVLDEAIPVEPTQPTPPTQPLDATQSSMADSQRRATMSGLKQSEPGSTGS